MVVSYLFKDFKLYFKSLINSLLYIGFGYLIRNCSILFIVYNIIMVFFFRYLNVVVNLFCKMFCAVYYKSNVIIYKLDNYGFI